jgi:hypothetical protein
MMAKDWDPDAGATSDLQNRLTDLRFIRFPVDSDRRHCSTPPEPIFYTFFTVENGQTSKQVPHLVHFT